jgi:hypothetical protein
MKAGRIMAAAVAAGALMSAAWPADAQRNRKGTQAMELDPTSRGAFSGVGIESRDIDMMADRVVRELTSRPDIVGSAVPSRIVVDSEKFYNDSAQRIDRDMVTGALRASLSRAAAGRIRFVSKVGGQLQTGRAVWIAKLCDKADSREYYSASAIVAWRAISCQPALRFAQTSVNGRVTCLPALGPLSGIMVS